MYFDMLRQDEPLSPFLFLLIVDILSRTVSKEVEANIHEGFEAGNDKLALSHL